MSSDWHGCAEPYPLSDAHAHTDAHADAHADARTDTHSDAYPNCNAGSFGQSNAIAYIARRLTAIRLAAVPPKLTGGGYRGLGW